MATQVLEAARYSGGSHKVKEYPEASGTLSFKKGEFVVMESDGQIVACSDGDSTILGMVLEDATGTENTMLKVLIAEDGTEFEINIYHATVGSAVTARTQLDTDYGYEVDSNRAYCDLGEGTKCFQITEILTGGGKAVGDTYGRVKVVVLPVVQQVGASAT